MHHPTQVTVHLKGTTECYECTSKPVPKSYPICTLRNTPDKPIHCIVWAKDLLFNRLFGAQDQATGTSSGLFLSIQGPGFRVISSPIHQTRDL